MEGRLLCLLPRQWTSFSVHRHLCAVLPSSNPVPPPAMYAKLQMAVLTCHAVPCCAVQLGMEDGDKIDCVVEQIGGAC